MSPWRVGALARRIVDQFLRDHRSLGLIFVAPLVIMALLGWILRDQGTPSLRVGVVDPTATVVGAVRGAAAGAELVVVELGLVPEGEAALRAGTLDALVVVPIGFAPVPPGSPIPIEIVVRGDEPGDAGIAGRLQRVLAEAAFGGGAAPFVVRPLFGRIDADVLDTFAPALIAFFGFFFVFILTGISFLRERVGGTLERLLATPIRRTEVVAGYSVGFGLFATIQVALILAFSFSSLAIPAGAIDRIAIGLGIPSAGSPLLAFLVVVLLAIGAVNLGIFLSTFARTELQILQFIPLVIVPQGLLGGVFWPIESLPGVLAPLARVMPLTYAVEGLRDVMVRGADLASRTLQLDLAFLAGTAVLFVVLAGATIRREVV